MAEIATIEEFQAGQCIVKQGDGSLNLMHDHRQSLETDVLLHAISDALLGAIGAGDIGKHFPDTDEAYAGADSYVLLQRVVRLVAERGYELVNTDATIIAQRPKMATYIPAMIEKVAQGCHVHRGQVNIKATTTEKLGFEGREEGIAAQAVVLLTAKNGQT
jgi:2-C-methyl-D-erythritol 2,4-cyclodiphosphate synthase